MGPCRRRSSATPFQQGARAVARETSPSDRRRDGSPTCRRTMRSKSPGGSAAPARGVAGLHAEETPERRAPHPPWMRRKKRRGTAPREGRPWAWSVGTLEDGKPRRGRGVPSREGLARIRVGYKASKPRSRAGVATPNPTGHRRRADNGKGEGPRRRGPIGAGRKPLKGGPRGRPGNPRRAVDGRDRLRRARATPLERRRSHPMPRREVDGGEGRPGQGPTRPPSSSAPVRPDMSRRTCPDRDGNRTAGEDGGP